MGREHVVVGGDDADVGRRGRAQPGLVVGRRAAKAWAKLAQDSLARPGPGPDARLHPLQVIGARVRLAPPDDPLGDLGEFAVTGFGMVASFRPGHNIRRAGPGLPDRALPAIRGVRVLASACLITARLVGRRSDRTRLASSNTRPVSRCAALRLRRDLGRGPRSRLRRGDAGRGPPTLGQRRVAGNKEPM